MRNVMTCEHCTRRDCDGIDGFAQAWGSDDCLLINQKLQRQEHDRLREAFLPLWASLNDFKQPLRGRSIWVSPEEYDSVVAETGEPFIHMNAAGGFHLKKYWRIFTNGN